LTDNLPAAYDLAGSTLGHGLPAPRFASMLGAGLQADVTAVSRLCAALRISRRRGSIEPGAVNLEEDPMPDEFEYVSQARLEYRHGYRHAYLGEVPAPVVYGVQGRLREYYGVAEGPPVASTLDHIVAAVAG
jgi:hypothetical protein